MAKNIFKQLAVLFIVVITLSFSGHCDESKTGVALLYNLKNRFDLLVNYSAVMVTKTKKGLTSISYTYKKPGFVKMDFITPHKGATLVYSPETQKATLRPFKTFKSIFLDLKPDNALIKSPGGHTIDKSDIGILIGNLILLSENGSISKNLISDSNNKISLDIKGDDGYAIDGINRYRIIVDTKILFPTQVTAFDFNGSIVEEMAITEVEIDKKLPEDTFF